ncbi:unnamed protein product [Chondrus crispus]|uniref:Uncharacterized protein n=1 Tax=Chondrus crispus TaxID=2769 RepID=R7QEG8_CHOCR|nr:unnamed protein product [Chondrus crispus]CDF36163.1 unnamed protein product [Chondrus crispus]|eukprot:XP_005715982.1 unnamed protein product [Chondrus crispus]
MGIQLLSGSCIKRCWKGQYYCNASPPCSIAFEVGVGARCYGIIAQAECKPFLLFITLLFILDPTLSLAFRVIPPHISNQDNLTSVYFRFLSF